MLFRKFGDLVHSVEPHFDSRATNEISFRRDRVGSCAAHEFEERYEKVSVSLVGGETEGGCPVQGGGRAHTCRRLRSTRAIDQLEGRRSPSGRKSAGCLLSEAERLERAPPHGGRESILLSLESRSAATPRSPQTAACVTPLPVTVLSPRPGFC